MRDAKSNMSILLTLPPPPEEKSKSKKVTEHQPTHLLLSAFVAVVIPNDLVEETTKLCVVFRRHGVAPKAGVFVVNASAHAAIKRLQVVIAESLALLGVQVRDQVLHAPVSGLRATTKGDARGLGGRN